MRQTPKALRFWCYVNASMVRLSVPVGGSIQWGRTGPTDEGYSFESNEWSADASGVTWEHEAGGRDCDGYTSHAGASFAAADQLAVNGWQDWPDVRTPEWERARPTVVHDAYAVAAGY